MEKVSIIVPIYNSEKYLNKCLESIINQSYNNIEILLIDDGSTDSSYNISKKYECIDNRIKLYKIKNSGVSYARNFGIKESTGDYISFVDSDDIIEIDFIEKLKESLDKKCDLAVCNYNCFYNDGSCDYNNYKLIGRIKNKIIKEKIFKDDYIRGFSCNKLFDAKIIKNNSIFFNESIHVLEDLLFCFNYLNYCKDVYVINDPLYHYRMRKSSASNTLKKINKSLTLFDAFDEMYKIDNNIYNYAKELYFYNYCKFHSEIITSRKDVHKINVFKMFFDNDINLKIKIKCLLFLIIPKKTLYSIRKTISRKKLYYE